MNITANDNGDDNFSPPKITTSQIEEQLVRNDITNEFYMPLSSTIVLKRKKKMMYVLLDFEKGLRIDDLVDSRAYVSAIAQTQFHRFKQQAPRQHLQNQRISQFSNAGCKWPVRETNINSHTWIGIADNIFAEHFVVMKNLTGPIWGLHFMRHKSLVIDTAYGLIHFRHLTMQHLKTLQLKQVPNPKLSLYRTTERYRRWQQKSLEHLLIIHQNGIQQVLWHRWESLQKQRVC